MLIFRIPADYLPNGGNHIDGIVRELGQGRGQHADLFSERLVLVDDYELLPMHYARAANHPYAGIAKIMLFNPDPQFFGEIFEFLVDLFRLHEGRFYYSRD